MLPTVDSTLCFDWREIHEAAHIFFSSPEDNMWWAGLSSNAKKHLNRSTFFFSQSDNFSPEFKKFVSMIKQAIKCGELEGFYENLGLVDIYKEKATYFVKNFDVVFWALLEEFIPSEKFQQKILIYPFRGNDKRFHRKVKHQIIGQYYLIKNPDMSVSDLCNLCNDKESNFSRFGEIEAYADKEKKAIRRHLNGLYDSAGEKGRHSKDKEVREKKKFRRFLLSPIPCVMKTKSIRSQYNFPLFKTALTTAIQIKLVGHEINDRENIKIWDLEYFIKLANDFFSELIIDKVMNVYFDKCSLNFLKIAAKIFLLEIMQYYPFLKTVMSGGNERQKHMLITNLYEIKSELCWEESESRERKVERTKKSVKIEISESATKPFQLRIVSSS